MKRKYFIISLIVIVGIGIAFFYYQNYSLPGSVSPSTPSVKKDRLVQERVQPSPLPSSEKPNEIKVPETIGLEVPFTSQAPFKNWSEPYQNACEEANIIMVIHWIKNIPLSKDEAKKEILALVDFQIENYGYYEDTSAIDTAKLLKQFYQYDEVEIKNNPNLDDIKKEIASGYLVIVPVNGRLLKNPYYTPPGPLHHMILIKGYDDKTREFITNDAGTSRGQSYRFPYETLLKAIDDYPSGPHLNRYQETRTGLIQNMIVVII